MFSMCDFLFMKRILFVSFSCTTSLHLEKSVRAGKRNSNAQSQFIRCGFVGLSNRKRACAGVGQADVIARAIWKDKMMRSGDSEASLGLDNQLVRS